MAVEWDLEDEEEESTSGGAGGEQISGAPALSTSNQPSDNPGTSSGSYTNLQKYIEANKGRDFGGQVAGKIGEETQSGVNQLNQQETQFKADVDSNTLNLDEGLKQRITDAPQALSQDDKNTATRIRTNSYAGPDSFSGGANEEDPYAQLRQYFGGLEETKKVMESPSGQSALLDKYYGRPTYTQGEKNLDTYLLGGQKEKLEQAKSGLQSALDTYGQKKTELDDYAKGAKEKSASSKADYYSLLGLDPTGTAMAYSRGAAPQGLIQKDLERLYSKEDARKNELSAQDSALKAAGLNLTNPATAIYKNLGGIDRTYGVNPMDYITKQDVNYQRTASPDDLARLGALSELAGLPQNYLDASLVGTQDDEALSSFDLDRFLSDTAIKKQNYEGTLRDTMVSTPERLRGLRVTAPTESLESVLTKGQPYYDEAKAYLAKYPDMSDSNALQRRAFIDQFGSILNQQEDIRKKYGYYDLIRR